MIRVGLLAVILLASGLPAYTAEPERGIDELLTKLADVRKQRGELENQERGLVGQIREKMLAQQQKLTQMGVSLDPPAPLPPVTQPPAPVPQPIPQPAPRAPATFAEELTAAYQADRVQRRGGPDDLKALARIYENSGQALDKAKPPTVGHLRSGIDVIVRVQLKQQLPAVVTLLQRHLALKLPDDSTPLNATNAVACKLVLLEVAAALGAVSP